MGTPKLHTDEINTYKQQHFVADSSRLKSPASIFYIRGATLCKHHSASVLCMHGLQGMRHAACIIGHVLQAALWIMRAAKKFSV
jgi:hypothetical protein